MTTTTPEQVSLLAPDEALVVDEVEVFRRAWTTCHNTLDYNKRRIVMVAYVAPRKPGDREVAIRHVVRTDPDWRATLCRALASDLVRGMTTPTERFPHPQAWGPDRVLKHWERFASGEFGAADERNETIHLRRALGLEAPEPPPTELDDDINF